METNRHHLFFERAEYRKHRIANLVREHPVNIHRTEVWRHQQLHHKMMGGLAVMSAPLGRELLEFLGDLPNDMGDESRRFIYLQREQYYLDRLTHRQGMLGKEATYFARAIEYQLPFVTPLEN